MRFSRDKRGYENTFVVHASGSRRRGKPRSRILYWFRTPPGVRVGRAALDEEAIKLIEEHNPDVEFDWTRILKGEGPERKPRDRESPEEPPRLSAPIEESASTDVVDDTAGLHAPAESSVAEGKLGAEGLARLRARHAEILARISEGISDPARRDELNSQAERLNPDTWVTEAEVAAGLESYETVFESLRTAVGRRRKRRRRRSRGDRPAAAQPPSAETTAAEDADDQNDQEEEI